MEERIQLIKFNKNNTRMIEFVVCPPETENRSAIHIFRGENDDKLDMERLVVKDMPKMTYNKITHARAIEKVLDMVDTKIKEGYVMV